MGRVSLIGILSMQDNLPLVARISQPDLVGTDCDIISHFQRLSYPVS